MDSRFNRLLFLVLFTSIYYTNADQAFGELVKRLNKLEDSFKRDIFVLQSEISQLNSTVDKMTKVCERDIKTFQFDIRDLGVELKEQKLRSAELEKQVNATVSILSEAEKSLESRATAADVGEFVRKMENILDQLNVTVTGTELKILEIDRRRHPIADCGVHPPLMNGKVTGDTFYGGQADILCDPGFSYEGLAQCKIPAFWESSAKCLPASDCQEMLESGFQTSGVYIIRLRGTREDVSVYCDMNSVGEGWTVIQKRYDGLVDFYRNWAEYKEGFGNPHGEYWIGNDIIHKWSSEGNYTLKIILTDWSNSTKVAVYNKFHVSGEIDRYRLTIDGYSGDAGNAMASLNGEEFTICHNDNGGACGVKNSGAWWCPCHLCCSTYLNAPYSNVSKVSYKQGINWFQWHGNYYALKATQMMIRKI